MFSAVGVEDRSYVCCDLAFEVLFSDIFLGVLLEMKLAALSGACVAGGLERSFKSGVGVRGDHVWDAYASLLEACQEVPPMNLGFGKCARDTEDHAFAVITSNSDGYECGAIPYSSVDADLVVGGVEEEERSPESSAIANNGEQGGDAKREQRR